MLDDEARGAVEIGRCRGDGFLQKADEGLRMAGGRLVERGEHGVVVGRDDDIALPGQFLEKGDIRRCRAVAAPESAAESKENDGLRRLGRLVEGVFIHP